MSKPAKDSLVLFKQSPAIVRACTDKIDIILPGGKTRSVREKDVITLHPGPVSRLDNLEEQSSEGQPEEAWELLQGEQTTLAELAELVYGEYSPQSAWCTFKLLGRSPWFKGTPDAIEIADPESVQARIKKEREKKQARQEWDDFFTRFKAKQIDREKDEFFLRDLENYALGRSKGSKILKNLGKTQSPENAHRIMLSYTVKEDTWNPHPLRLNVPLSPPECAINDIPDEKRLDLSAYEAFAIDDEKTQDPDDALCWDGERLWVHVADVAAVIHSGSQADEAAMERASSLYLPECTVPMLPHEAARKLGMGLSELSPALSYAFRFDEEWNVRDFSVHLTQVRVSRLSYVEANSRMDDERFKTIKTITDASKARRKAAGSISINMPEVSVCVDEAKNVSITALPDLPSRQMVSEAMLMAGYHVALLAIEQDIPVPFAVQEVPEDAVSDAEQEEPLEKESYVSRFNRRRGMKRSRITLKSAAHRGLGLDAYCRVTSPLRRYSDLIASRQIRAYILGEEYEDEESLLKSLAVVDSQSGTLVQAERRSTLFWKLHWLKAHPGYSAEAWMLDRRDKQGIFLIPEIALEIRVSLKKDVNPGDRVVLKLKEVDIPELSALFTIL